MQPFAVNADTNRYAKAVEVSKRLRWEIDRDLIRGRRFDHSKKFLPDGLSMVQHLARAVEKLRGGVRGPIVVGAIQTTTRPGASTTR